MQFQLEKTVLEPLKCQLKMTFQDMNESSLNQRQQLEQRRKGLVSNLNTLKVRFGIGEISYDIYCLSETSLSEQLAIVDREVDKLGIQLSNPDKFIDFALHITQNIDCIWERGGINIKQSVQQLVFPQGIYYDTTSDSYRTDSINNLFSVIAAVARISGNNPTEEKQEKACNSALVVPTRIEPVSKV